MGVILGFIKSSDHFDFWWNFFKTRMAPILYPTECKNLDLMDKSLDIGFAGKCPCRIHLMVIDMILERLEHPQSAHILYGSFKDISLFVMIFRQSFSLMPQYYETVSKLVRIYRAWICQDSSTYTWPEIMQENCNIYYRVFIDNLSQVFFMKIEESSMELHVDICNEVLEIFMHFTTIKDGLEFGTSRDLFKVHMRICGQLVKKGRSDDKHDQEYSSMLEKPCFRNLFIIWIKCYPQDASQTGLWNSLLDNLEPKFTESSVFHFWKITVLYLTRAVIQETFHVPSAADDHLKLYESEIYESSGKRAKKPKFTPRTDVIDLKDFFDGLKPDTTLCMWHRMINMVGTSNLLSEGWVHTQKIRVIGEVVDIFLQISQIEVKVAKGTTTPDFVHSPETAHVLRLFIEWILEACDRTDSNFTEGRSLAYATLCKILCHKSRDRKSVV